jgi:hypothetical protein
MKNPSTIYANSKSNAKSRGINFTLTFEEWYDVWQASGKWEERGKKKGQYVMSRKGDVGPYAIGNVFIQSMADNCREAHCGKKYALGYKHSSEAKLKISEAFRGKSKPPRSEEHRRKLSEAAKNRKKA